MKISPVYKGDQKLLNEVCEYEKINLQNDRILYFPDKQEQYFQKLVASNSQRKQKVI